MSDENAEHDALERQAINEEREGISDALSEYDETEEDVCPECEGEGCADCDGDPEYGASDYAGDDEYEIAFADPGGRSALRAETADNPRNLPCPSCGAENVLTPQDRALGYQCDRCADIAERGY